MKELNLCELYDIWCLVMQRWTPNGSIYRWDNKTNGSLGSVLYTARCGARSDDADENVLAYAGGLLYYIASAQHLIDGNKRLAWGACTRALEINGFTLEVNDDDAEALTLNIGDSQAPGHISSVVDTVEQLSEWIDELPT